MTKKEKERIARILPDGIPRWVRCYDNGGESFDRYTVCFTGRWKGKPVGYYPYLGMSEFPYSPQGFGQHGDSGPGGHCDAKNGTWPPPVGGKNHLGKRINFTDLPPDCQRCVLEDYKDYWGIPISVS